MIKDNCYSHIFIFLARSVVLFSITILLLWFLLSKAIYVYMIVFFMFGAQSTVFLLFVWASQQSRLLSFIFIGETVSDNCMHIPYITHNNLNIASHLNIESHLNIASHLQRPTNRSKITLTNNEICNV